MECEKVIYHFGVGCWVLSAIIWASENSPGSCTSLLESVIRATETQVKNGELQNTANPLQLPQKWNIGTGPFSVAYSNGQLTLLGGKKERVLKAELTPDQVARLKSYSMRRAENFGSSFGDESNLAELKKGVNFAKLHSAFYAETANPMEAAKQIEALIARSDKRNPYLKTKITVAPTSAQFVSNIKKFADSLEGVMELHRDGKLEGAVQEIKRESDRKEGARVLAQILGKTPETSLEDVLENTRNQQVAKAKLENPEAVDLTIEYAHEVSGGDNNLTLHIERSPPVEK